MNFLSIILGIILYILLYSIGSLLTDKTGEDVFLFMCGAAHIPAMFLLELVFGKRKPKSREKAKESFVVVFGGKEYKVEEDVFKLIKEISEENYTLKYTADKFGETRH